MKTGAVKLLYRSRKIFLFYITTGLLLFSKTFSYSQNIANYVTNGSFEKLLNCQSPFIEYKAVGWSGIDSSKGVAPLCNITCGNAPHTGAGYQLPFEGDGFARVQFYCPPCGVFTRANLRNRLKNKLIQGKLYCVKMLVCLQDSCELATDKLGIFFGDGSLDTIIYNARMPLTFLTPQIINPSGNFIKDTANWIPVTGTFVATGSEKYLVINNFSSDLGTSTVSSGVNLTGIQDNFVMYNVDGVSCIELGVAAYAGRDTAIVPGDSAFIGREPDFAVDPYCTWYQWPNMLTPIKVTSGMWVKPVITTTYIVKQNLECGNEKWDTVVVYMNPVGFSEKLKVISDGLNLFPIPANDKIVLNIVNIELLKHFDRLIVYNNLGEMLRKEELHFEENNVTVNTRDFADGIYSLYLKSETSGTVSKRFVIQH